MIWGFDTENDPDSGEVTIICFVTHNRREVFRDTITALEFLCGLEGENLMFAVNAGYDIRNIFGEAWELVNVFITGSSNIVGGMLYHNRGVRFIDLVVYTDLGAAELGEIVGLKKLEREVVDKVHDEEYCLIDAEIAYRAGCRIAEFWAVLGTRPHFSAGATALEAFERRNPGLEVGYPRFMSKFIDERLRPAYYGGRCEVFEYGAFKDVNYYDINSCYPYVMGAYLYPYLRPHKIGKDVPDQGVVSGLFWDRSEPPILPIKVEGSKSEYPGGIVRGVYPVPLIKYSGAVDVIKVDWSVSFPSSGLIFREFVEWVYPKRLEGSLEKKFYKRICNALYGKFGQGNKSTHLVKFDPSRHKPPFRVYGKYALLERVGPYSRHSNFIWAAYTTALAACTLWRALNVAGERLIYCDTDGLFMAGELPARMIDDKELGAFKVERVDEFEVKQPKVYRKGSEYHAKGVPADLQEAFFHNGFAEFKRPLGLRESLAEGAFRGVKWSIFHKSVIDPLTKGSKK